MGLAKPYHRNYRPIKSGSNSGWSEVAYIRDPSYAKSASAYVRAFRLIQKDLERLFEYVEPRNESLSTYSFRIHELLVRACIEIEANFKAILNENLYAPARNINPNMTVYRKVNITHHLSSYELDLAVWHGPKRIIRPFETWMTGRSGNSPQWYSNYNASKHDRLDEFKKANMESLIDAVAGLLALISSQFRQEDFSPGGDVLTIGGLMPSGFEGSISSIFSIKFPTDWTDAEKYDFDWGVLHNQSDRFARFDYNQVP